MSALTEGDIVTLVSGSPRLAVEKIEARIIHCVWCNEGVIHRDAFDAALVRKWEVRGDDRDGGGRDRSGGRDRDGGRDRGNPRDPSKRFGDDKRGGGKPFNRR